MILVLNQGFTFSLSNKALIEYIERKSIDVFVYDQKTREKWSQKPHYKIPLSEYDYTTSVVLIEDYGNKIEKLYSIIHPTKFFNQYHIYRNDPILVDIVKKMRNDASTPNSDLQLIEVEDTGQWEIISTEDGEILRHKYKLI